MACSTSCSHIHLYLVERSGTKLFSWDVTGVLTTTSTIHKCSPLCQVEVHTALNVYVKLYSVTTQVEVS